MAKKKVTRVAEELLTEFLAREGYELYTSEFVKEGSDWFLRIYIDKIPQASGEEDWISTEDCEKVSRYLSERLDEADPIEQNYYLEVSSPGLDRPLLTEAHYLRYIGREVDIRLYKALEGSKEHSGVLAAYEHETVTLQEPDGTSLEIPVGDIARARLAVIF